MKSILASTFFTLGALLMSQSVSAASGFYSMNAESITGEKTPLSKYEGKVALVVNTASQCGYTPQYKDLEALYEKYRAKGLVVLAFPSNDFGGQEPGSNAEVKSFCELKYKTTFPLFAKGPVKGDAKQPVYKFLTESDPKLAGEVSWNFEKFLIDPQGKIVGRYKSKVTPMSDEITSKVESLLASAKK